MGPEDVPPVLCRPAGASSGHVTGPTSGLSGDPVPARVSIGDPTGASAAAAVDPSALVAKRGP
eukprot:5126925-Prorocentrum_lima.AAC.1